tara:strand:- start:18714 stop:19754 length:1041 start_codon:yes stop_codon:yes gene_type:complete
MASKNIHETIGGYHPEVIVKQLGFEDHKEVGLLMNNLEVATVTLSESKAQYDKVKGLLNTETTSNLTQLKKAFILPMHNVSTDRLKAALKEHKISVTNDYEKADFIIPHTNCYDSYSSIENIPQTKMMFHLKNGYYSNTHREVVKDYHKETGNNVILDKRALGDRYQHNIDYESLPYDSYVFSNMAIMIADMVEQDELDVVQTDTILNQSANRVPITEELMEDLKNMIGSYSSTDEEIAMAGKIIPTIDPTGEPYLLYTYAEFLENNSYKYNRNKDVLYWLEKHDIESLACKNAEQAIQYFENRDMLDSRCFRALEVLCRKQIQISNRELYTFKVQVKPEYRKYMK